MHFIKLRWNCGPSSLTAALRRMCCCSKAVVLCSLPFLWGIQVVAGGKFQPFWSCPDYSVKNYSFSLVLYLLLKDRLSQHFHVIRMIAAWDSNSFCVVKPSKLVITEGIDESKKKKPNLFVFVHLFYPTQAKTDLTPLIPLYVLYWQLLIAFIFAPGIRQAFPSLCFLN